MAARSALFFATSILLLSALANAQTNALTGDVALREAHISSQMRSDIVAAIVRDLPPGTDSRSREIALNSWVSFPRLAQGDALVVQVVGGPDNPAEGATGNGPIWLFKQVGVHAVLILDSFGSTCGPASETFHQGMRDFQTSGNSSAGQGGVEVYRFDGKQYKPAYCYEYSEDENGNVENGPREPCVQ